MELTSKLLFTNPWRYFRYRRLTTKYIIDRPKTLYHPLPWIGLNTAKREKGTQVRLDMIKNKIGDSKGSVFDFGSAEGFFSISLAKMGHLVLALEAKQDRIEISKFVADILKIKNISFLNMKVDDNNISSFPTFTFTICLAVFHHWVRYFSFDRAESMLISLWKKTDKYMFFETGLAELPKSFGMPTIHGDYDEWLLNYLKNTLPNSSISILGKAPSFSADQFGKTKIKHDDYSFQRNIYCITRTHNDS